MATVILKDANGNDVEYSGVTAIDVPVTSAAGEIVTNRFTSLLSSRAYVIEKNGSADGVACYKILDSLQWWPSNYCLQFSITDDKYQSYGGDGVICFVTTKNLNVGETYKMTDMY